MLAELWISRRKESMSAWSVVGRRVSVALLVLGAPTVVHAQTEPRAAAQPVAARLSMDDAVRLAVAHNQQLRAIRLTIDQAKADEITAGLKPNPVVTSTNENFPVFSPSQLTPGNFANNQNFIEAFSYLFERGGKRQKRTLVAQDTTDSTTKAVRDAENQLIFQTRQAFINVLLAKSTLDLTENNLANFTSVVEVNQQRVTAGDLAEAEFYKILLQKLQFEQDLSAAELALVQAKAALRQNVGFEAVREDFEVEGDLGYTKYVVTLDELKRDALAARPDLQVAQAEVKLAQDVTALEYGNRARDVIGGLEYDRAGSLNALGFTIAVELPFHDRNQGNIARSQVAVRQATANEVAVREAVLTDVVSAYAAFQTNEKIVSLFQSGYLSQAQQSLDITTYVYQQGSGSLLDLLDAERTYRAIQMTFRQALAAYMISVQELNFVIGRQVIP
jgi:outer membrane protein, heavy metal efflux system